MKREKLVTEVYSSPTYPSALLDFRDWINSEINKIPDDQKEHAGINIGEYYIEIFYNRQETDSEYEYRINKESEVSEQIKQRELKKLAELKAKYEQ